MPKKDKFIMCPNHIRKMKIFISLLVQKGHHHYQSSLVICLNKIIKFPTDALFVHTLQSHALIYKKDVTIIGTFEVFYKIRSLTQEYVHKQKFVYIGLLHCYKHFPQLRTVVFFLTIIIVAENVYVSYFYVIIFRQFTQGRVRQERERRKSIDLLKNIKSTWFS